MLNITIYNFNIVSPSSSLSLPFHLSAAQDAGLDALAAVITRQKTMGQDIGNELDEQNGTVSSKNPDHWNTHMHTQSHFNGQSLGTTSSTELFLSYLK